MSITVRTPTPTPTDADRVKAAELRRQLAQIAGWPNRDEVLAAALAAQREAALAPVHAAADELDAWRENALRHARSCPPTSTEAAKSYGRAAAYQRAAARIRAAIDTPEETR